jgi:hypothetical protein
MKERTVIMKRYPLIVVMVLLLSLAMGCGKKHPVKVYVDPQLKEGSVDKVGVFPFTSTVHHADDPDGVSAKTLDIMFRDELDLRTDYNFMSVAYAVESAGLKDEAENFIEEWRNSKSVDVAFLNELSQTLQLDAVLIGVVDLWQKDEVDVRENATPATYVGATITILGVDDGSILFEASDEDVQEGASQEDEFEEVATRVVRALVPSIPVR